MDNFDFWQMVVLPFFNFALFLGVLVYFGKSMLHQMAKVRADNYSSLAEKAHKLMVEAKKEKEALENEQKNFADEVAKSAAVARKEAEEHAKMLLAEADHHAKNLTQDLTRMLAAEEQKIQEELRTQLLAEVKQKLLTELGREITLPVQQAYLEKNLSQLAKINPL